ncbi:MAG: cell division protein ZapA [Methylococcales bacterium]|jgi:cell division protein ZapA|nr:cell division protein ZapA [Methylococcales bacterium]MBT7442554.1 cell division protein ZapA [Methylococcales bacterium]
MASATPITFKILGKEYRVACPAGEEASLHQAASYLQQKMQEIKQSGRIIGADQIAVMAALNISHELLAEQQKKPEIQQDTINSVRNMQHKIKLQLTPSEGEVNA